ncbi:hypothetical protein ACIRD2_08760 [Streptomyces sp. NPDC093595]|uniref:hypothetical protein n=1 Tax=Streptomyces sp. NPDC093595 TaxID=3366045 RepID=UPI0037F5001C
MSQHQRRRRPVIAAVAVGAGLVFGSACAADPSTAPTPSGETTTRQTQSATPDTGGERKHGDLVRFELEDRSAGGTADIRVVWTIKNNSDHTATYSWKWEAVDAKGVRVAGKSQPATEVKPGRTITGEHRTTLKTTEGITLNVTSFHQSRAG